MAPTRALRCCTHRTTRVAGCLVAAAGLLVAGLTTSSGPAAAQPRAASTHAGVTAASGRYRATIQRTAGGVAHITANDFGSLGFGFGDAFASDDICTMAKDFVTVEGLRSKYFGGAKSYTTDSNGVTVTNLDSDIYWKGVAASGLVKRELAVTTGPAAILPPVRRLIRGYVDGYNHYLQSVGGPSGITDPTCKGRSWVTPITLTDEYLRLAQLTGLSSSDLAIQGIAEAAPPTTSGAEHGASPGRAQAAELGHRLAVAGIGGHAGSGLGSNAIAIGRKGNRDRKHGLLLGNPHFPWTGTERFYEVQLTVPGRMDVEGGALYGVPLVLIGHTASLAWSHTVSTAFRFVPIQLTLASGDPTSYLIGSTRHAMTTEHVQVQSKQPDGSLTTVTSTLYATKYGPVFDTLMGISLPWTSTNAYALFDANAGNTRILNHYFRVDQAQSVKQLRRILDRYEGLPWVNTIAADRSGHAMYADIGSIPNVTDAEAHRCDTSFGTVTFALDRLPILNGSRTGCAPATSRGAAAPGIFAPKQLPILDRSDYVTNSNDSFWLSNPAHPLTGFPQIIGDTGTPRSLRTRIGLIMTQQRIAGTDGHGKPGFTRQTMQQLMFSDRQYGAELVLTPLVRMCRRFKGGLAPTSAGGTVKVGSSCAVLAHWNARENIHSRGAVLFRAFWEKALALQEGPWQTPFNPSRPVTTPNGLDTSDHNVRTAFGDALLQMKQAHLPYNVELGTVQYVLRHGHRIPLHGGPGDPDGDFNAIYQDVFSGRGQPPSIGSSYIQVVTWHSAHGCPDVATMLTYSQSSNPFSRWYDDQTKRYSKKKWETEYFCRAAVAKHTLSSVTVTGPRST